MMMKSVPDSSSMATLVLVMVLLPGWTSPCSAVDVEQPGFSPGVASQTLLRCFRATDPNIRSPELLYNANTEEGYLWSGTGVAPNCSFFSGRPRSGCDVCFQTHIYVRCNNLTQNTKLTMEGNGQHINIVPSDCPQLLSDPRPDVGAGNPTGRPTWWLLPFSFSLFIIIISVT